MGENRMAFLTYQFTVEKNLWYACLMEQRHTVGTVHVYLKGGFKNLTPNKNIVTRIPRKLRYFYGRHNKMS